MYKNNIARFFSIIVIVLILLQGSIITSFGISLSDKTKENGLVHPSLDSLISDNSDISKILKPQDEGDHFPCGYELWCYHASLTLENGEKWDAAATFVYFMNKTFGRYKEGLSWLRIRHWNRTTNDYYDYFQYDKFPGVFTTTKDMVNISYYKSNITGLYPDYHIHCEDPKYNIISDLSLHAISSPCWLLNQTTNKRLPWGFTGWGKVYFIPLMEVNGTIKKNGRTFNATGYAYFEHDFLFVDFADPFSIHSPDEFLMCSLLTLKSAKWLISQGLKNRLIEEPLSIHRSNDYLFGWCWSWVVFDNDWNMVIFRPAILGTSSGRVPVFLYFTKDQKSYLEIGNIYWNNKKEKYISKADIYIPENFEIAVYRDDIEFKLSFTSTSEMTELFSEDVSPNNKRKSCTFYSCGNVDGYYIDEDNNLRLNGVFAIEQSRWLSRYDRHRSVDIELLIPPNGFGISIKKVSHWLLLEKFFKFQLKPNFDFTFYIRKSPE
jgi:hypothetical protein